MTAWDDVVSAALMGTSRRAAALDDLPTRVAEVAGRINDADPAARTLDVAALLTTARRAGRRPLPPPSLPEPAPRESGREAGTAADARLRGLLAAQERDLALWWVQLAAERGVRAPASALPALLDLAVTSEDARRAVAPVIGERGRWLAGFRSQWSALAASSDDSMPTDDEPWQTGSTDERRRWLEAMCRHDRPAARAAIGETWASDRADLRRAWLDVLGRSLNPDDEPFLESALDDRSGTVRERAAELLASLPTSALARRMADRARQFVRVERARLRERLVVTLPERRDDTMVRDGIAEKRSAGAGGRQAFWLEQIIAAAPLQTWTTEFARTPVDILALPVDDDASGVVRAGLVCAAERQRDATWAIALCTTSTDLGELVRLVRTAVPATQRAELLLARFGALPRGDTKRASVVAMFTFVPPPWPADLTRAFLDSLLVSSGYPPEMVRDAGMRMALGARADIRAVRDAADASSAGRALEMLEHIVVSRQSISEELM